MNDLADEKLFFKEQMEQMRKKLENSRANGILEDNFEDELETLLSLEKKILTSLIPYSRDSDSINTDTSIHIQDTLSVGNIKLNRSIREIYTLNEELYMVNTLDNKIYFLKVNANDNKTVEINWSLPIPELRERLLYAGTINEGQIILFTAKNNIYLLEIKNLEDISKIHENIEIKKQNNPSKQISRCVRLTHNLFITENSEGKLNLLEFTTDHGLKIIDEMDSYYCTDIKVIREDYFLLGNRDGNLCFITITDEKFQLLEEKKIFKERIRNIDFLENENGTKENVIILGDKGKLAIISLHENTLLASYSLEGNLFDLSSKEGTAIILSENGHLYLFEENFNAWSFNEETTIKDVFFTKVLSFQRSNYFVVDLENAFKIIDIHRITTAEDLWNASIVRRKNV